MQHVKPLAFALLLFLLAAGTLTAGGDAFLGAFDGKGFDGKSSMEWVFKKGKDGAVSVSVMIFQPQGKSKKSLGRGPGKNVKVQGDKLEFEIDWFQSQPIKGPKGAKYVAEINDNKLTVNWSAGDDKGELTAVNRNPKVVAKKDDKKGDKTKSVTSKVYLSGLTDDKLIPIQKGTVTQLALVIPMGKASKAQWLKVTRDTKFVLVNGDESKTYNQNNVLDDPAVRMEFRERYVTLERQGNVALTVTATAKKK
ncbi:MAG TPA: hypothetical protein VEL76_10390 [Gemmataceae bacterium]|nr:hypothetical protein [Gemmataceae bacterium]